MVRKMNQVKKRPLKKEIRFLGDGRNLQCYLKEIGRHKGITAEEEAVLARRIRMNDRGALNQLICSNLKFVVSVCWNYRNQGLTMPELINEGNLGLMRAAHRFDETKQFKFISYAVWWIRQSVLQALGEQARLVKLPFSRIHALTKVNRTNARLEQKLGRSPSAEELSDVLGVDVAAIHESTRISQAPLSLYTPMSGENSSELIDILQDENNDDPENRIIEQDLHHGIEQALKTLAPKEETVLRMHYGVGLESVHSLEEIGVRFNLTRERVRQIKEKALNKLKHSSRYKALSAYAEG
jgi:RNA polymerase primary sigma factor